MAEQAKQSLYEILKSEFDLGEKGTTISSGYGAEIYIDPSGSPVYSREKRNELFKALHGDPENPKKTPVFPANYQAFKVRDGGLLSAMFGGGEKAFYKYFENMLSSEKLMPPGH